MSPVTQQTYVTELNDPNREEEKKKHPDSGQIWLPWYNDLIPDASSTCNHYYAASSGKSCLNRERCDPAPLLPISSFASASVESPHLWGNSLLQPPQLQMGWMSLYSDPIWYRSWDLYLNALFSFVFFSCITFQFLISVWLNYTREQCSV